MRVASPTGRRSAPAAPAADDGRPGTLGAGPSVVTLAATGAVAARQR
ncbi:hypothetical protein [Sanguibacter sp. 25GB23B1]